MKKIISVLLVVALLAVGVIAALPASAATTHSIKWSDHEYVSYTAGGSESSEEAFLNAFNLTKNETSLGATRKSTSGQSQSYISTTQFAITSETNYTYEVQAKLTNTTKYAGVPFAIDGDGDVVFLYGCFDNNNDTNLGDDEYAGNYSGYSYLVPARNDFDNKILAGTSANDEHENSAYFKKLQQDSGFATLKFEYNGLSVKISAKDTNGTFVQVAGTVTLSAGAKVCFGIFCRDATNGGDRTITVKNGKITANNAAAEANLVIDTNGIGALKTLVTQCKTDYANEADYTAASYDAYKTALTAAEAVIAKGATATKTEVSSAKAALETAMIGLELATLDFTALDEAIAKAEALKAVEYTDITFKMVTDAVAKAKALKEKADAKQSDVVAMVEDLNGKIDGLVPSGEIAPPDEDADGDADADADAPATDAPAADGSATDAPVAPAESGSATTETPAAKKGGCGGAIATTAVVVGLVATLGTALVVKKKD